MYKQARGTLWCGLFLLLVFGLTVYVVFSLDIEISALLQVATAAGLLGILCLTVSYGLIRRKINRKIREAKESKTENDTVSFTDPECNYSDFFEHYNDNKRKEIIGAGLLASLVLLWITYLWYEQPPRRFIASTNSVWLPLVVLLLWWLWGSWFYTETILGYNVKQLPKLKQAVEKDSGLQRLLDDSQMYASYARIWARFLLFLIISLCALLFWIACNEPNTLIAILTGTLLLYHSTWQFFARARAQQPSNIERNRKSNSNKSQPFESCTAFPQGRSVYLHPSLQASHQQHVN
jgi:hypothetical protein